MRPVRRADNLTTIPPSCAVVKKSGNLNFLETSGPLQACNGTALHFLPQVNSGRLPYIRPRLRARYLRPFQITLHYHQTTEFLTNKQININVCMSCSARRFFALYDVFLQLHECSKYGVLFTYTSALTC
jgi:hypothetical protein